MYVCVLAWHDRIVKLVRGGGELSILIFPVMWCPQQHTTLFFCMCMVEVARQIAMDGN